MKNKKNNKKIKVGVMSCVVAWSAIAAMSPASADTINSKDVKKLNYSDIIMYNSINNRNVILSNAVNGEGFGSGFENLGYTQNAKYNFSDLKFNPEVVNEDIVKNYSF